MANLEVELVKKQANFKDNSLTIRNLKKQIAEYKTAITRPSEVLLEYRKIRNNALKEELRVRTLQDMLSQMNFEERNTKRSLGVNFYSNLNRISCISK